MNPRRVSLQVLILMLLIIPAASSQDGDGAYTCPEITQTALAHTDVFCEDTGRNQACYGHALVDTAPQPWATDFIFSTAGDIAELSDVQSMRFSPMDIETGMWGVSLMRVQGNLPDASSQYITFLTFGDVMIENQAELVTTIDVTANVTDTNVIVRHFPSRDGFILNAIEPGTVVTATGRLEDNSWLRVVVPDTQETGWVHASLLAALDGADIGALHVVEPNKPYYRPMEAFMLRTGVDDAPCVEAPESGLLIQTPEGVAEIRLLINEVAIRLGSTAFVQAEWGGDLIVNLLEGSGWVEANGFAQPLFPGARVRVALDANGKAIGIPSGPEPYLPGLVNPLPVEQLDFVFEPAPPLSYNEIDAQVNAIAPGNSSLPGQDDDVEGSDGGSDPDQDGDLPGDTAGSEDGGDDEHVPPGLVDNPALGDDGPPGQTGAPPPGQAKKDK